MPYKKGEQYSTFMNMVHGPFPGPCLERMVNIVRILKNEITKSETRMPLLSIYPRAMKTNVTLKLAYESS